MLSSKPAYLKPLSPPKKKKDKQARKYFLKAGRLGYAPGYRQIARLYLKTLDEEGVEKKLPSI